MPSVAMKGGIFSLAMMVPETSPHSAPESDAPPTTPSGIGSAPSVRNTPRDDGAEGHQRADRQVDAAGDDDEGGRRRPARR